MSKDDIRLSSKVKIGFQMSKFDIGHDLECQIRILNVIIRYLSSNLMSK